MKCSTWNTGLPTAGLRSHPVTQKCSTWNILIALCLLLSALALISCSNGGAKNLPSIATELPLKTYWSEPYGTPCGVAVLTHGLNLKPQKMQELSMEINSLGYVTGIVALAGHRREDLRPVSFIEWRNELMEAVKEAKAAYPNLPLTLVGYSLGGALSLSVIKHDPGLKVDSLVLIAPALATTWRADIIRPFTWLRIFATSLPSFAPSEYRVKSFTSLEGYRATIDAFEDVQQMRDVANTPKKAILFLNPRDELISLDGTRSYLRANGLTTWRIVTILADGDTDIQHLMVDRESVGVREWGKLVFALSSFLGCKSQLR